MTESRAPRPLSARPAVLLPLLLALALPAWADDVASVDATLTIAEPVLPAPKAGGRLLKHAFGQAPGTVVRDEIAAELRELGAFRDLVADGGEMRLEIKVTSVKDDFRDVGEGESGSSYGLELEAETAWFRGETPLHAQRFELTRRVPVDEHPTRGLLQSTLAEAIRELGERAFSSLYESEFFEGTRKAGGGRPDRTGVAK